jgi:hypothetical protein
MSLKTEKESTIKIISKNSKGIPDGVTIFVDGKKTTKELDKIDPNLIESMNVFKGKCLENMAETAKMVLLIITKNISLLKWDNQSK